MNIKIELLSYTSYFEFNVHFEILKLKFIPNYY